MIGIDANVLVALAVAGHPHHARAVRAFEQILAAGEQIVLSVGVAAEFLHVVTDPRRIEPAREMPEAVTWPGHGLRKLARCGWRPAIWPSNSGYAGWTSFSWVVSESSTRNTRLCSTRAESGAS